MVVYEEKSVDDVFMGRFSKRREGRLWRGGGVKAGKCDEEEGNMCFTCCVTTCWLCRHGRGKVVDMWSLLGITSRRWRALQKKRSFGHCERIGLSIFGGFSQVVIYRPRQRFFGFPY